MLNSDVLLISAFVCFDVVAVSLLVCSCLCRRYVARLRQSNVIRRQDILSKYELDASKVTVLGLFHPYWYALSMFCRGLSVNLELEAMLAEAASECYGLLLLAYSETVQTCSASCILAMWTLERHP